MRSRAAGTAVLAMLVGCSGAAPPPAADAGADVIARIDGRPIRVSDVAPAVAMQLYHRQLDVYTLLTSEAERLIDARLLEAEAARRGVTVASLLADEVDRDLPAPSDAEVDAYLAEHPPAASPASARERTRAYLRERTREERRLALLGRLRGAARIEVVLSPPERPRARLDVAGAPARGPADAPLTVVHFASFSSARSARSAGYLRRLEAELPGQVRWVHRTFLAMHDERGLRAAALAQEAVRAGTFWQLHDALFAAEGRWSEEDLRRIATAAGAPADPDAAVSASLGAIKREMEHGLLLGVQEPPVIFVNGRYFSPTFPYEALLRLAKDELAAAPRDPRLSASSGL